MYIKEIHLFVDDITGFDAADLDRDLIAERLKKDDVRASKFAAYLKLFFFCTHIFIE
jgi:hypothetical protein